MKYKIYTLIFSFLSIGLYSYSQPGKAEASISSRSKKVEQLLPLSSYYNALDYLESLKDSEPKNLEILNELAKTYGLARDYFSALHYYGELLEKDINKDFPETKLNYALFLKRNNQYQEALRFFKELLLDQNEASLFIENEINGCLLALNSSQENLLANVIVLESNINSAYTEYSPSLDKNNALIFSSLKSNDYIHLEEEKEEVLSKIYKSEILNGVYQDPQLLNPIFNSENLHVGHGSYSSDGNRFYFTKCPTEVNNQVKCKIYISEKKSNSNSWSTPILLDQVNLEGFKSTTPFVLDGIANREIICFASDRPGGYGGMDIWRIERNSKGEYENLQNGGELINTFGDEICPFYSYYDNHFYFSSNGHPSYGGMDVFKTDLKTSAKNLGAFVNSASDEMYFTLDKKNEYGFLVSNRVGGQNIHSATCCDDIFKVNIEKQYITLNLFVKDADSIPIENAQVKRYEIKLEKNVELYEVNVPKTGYSATYPLDKEFEIVASSPSYSTSSITLKTHELQHGQVLNYDFILNQLGVQLTGFVYKDGDREIKELLLDASVIAYKRNKFTGEWDVYKESLSSINPYIFFLQLEEDYKVEVSKEGYLSEVHFLSTMNAQDGEKLTHDFYLKELKKDLTFRIENVYYAFNKAELLEGSEPSLELLLQFIEVNPNIVIEIGSHSDSKGSDKYNLELSQKRAETVVNYLLRNGISSDKLIPKGYGESKPAKPNENPDGSDSPENRQFNRRTEFKIVGF